jgi:hypothetical protein
MKKIIPLAAGKKEKKRNIDNSLVLKSGMDAMILLFQTSHMLVVLMKKL